MRDLSPGEADQGKGSNWLKVKPHGSVSRSDLSLTDCSKLDKSLSFSRLPFPQHKVVLWFQCVPQSPCVGNIIPKAAMLEGGIHERWLGHEVSALMNELMPISWEWGSYHASWFVMKVFSALAFLHSPSLAHLPPPWHYAAQMSASCSWISQPPEPYKQINFCSF